MPGISTSLYIPSDTRSLAIGESNGPILPFRFAGGDLGLPNPGTPSIYVLDRSGVQWITHSVEWILRNIEHFTRRCQLTLLAGAALHYGHDAWALMGADFQSKWSVLDDSGRVLLADVTHAAATEAANAIMKRPGWIGDIKIRVQRGGGKRDARHDGPLKLLHHTLGLSSFTAIAVRSHAGRCGIELEEALWRIDQFSDDDQAELLAGVAAHFGLPAEEVAQ